MRWFWRAALAVVAGTALGTVAVFAISTSDYPGFSMWLFTNYPAPYLAVTAACLVGVYVLVTDMLVRRASGDTETRCRECGYILRGIAEPRCSECGERI